MSEFLLTVNRQAENLSSALVRNATDLSPVFSPQLVIGGTRPFRVRIVSNGAIDDVSGDSDYDLILSIGRKCAYPEGGTYNLTIDGAEPATVNFDATPESLAGSLSGLSTVGAGNVSVTGVAGKAYRVEFVNDKEDTNVPDIEVQSNSLTPASNILITTEQEGGGGNNEVQIIRLRQKPVVLQTDWTPDTDSWTADISTANWESIFALANEEPFEGILEIKLVDDSGNVDTIAQVPVTILCDVNPV